MATLASEVDNLRAALEWSTRRGDAEHGLYLGLVFGTLGQYGGMLAEARGWLERGLALPGGDSLLRARAHLLLGRIAIFQGDTDAGEAAGRQALALAGEERWIRVMALNLLGLAELDRGPSDTARQWFEQALALAESHPDTALWVPLLLTRLGLVAGLRHDFAEARQRFEAALAALPPDGMEAIRDNALANLGWVLHELGERAQSAAVLRESLGLQWELRDVLALQDTVDGAARHALDAARPDIAARLLGAAEALRKRGGMALPAFNLEFYQTMVARAQEALGETNFAAAWDLGAGLPLDQAVAEADALLAAIAGRPGPGISGE
jgi:tetratricopeptide (TPR) repeat protein